MPCNHKTPFFAESEESGSVFFVVFQGGVVL